jgi:hypothetical protein
MDHYSQNVEEDKIARVKADMDDVKNVMVDNIEKVLSLSFLPNITSKFPISICDVCKSGAETRREDRAFGR